jgi:uncharacterized protein
VTLKTSDGLELGAWYFPAGQTGRGVTVLVPSGNAGRRSLRAPLARSRLSVQLFDYRGFSGNPGTPTEEGLSRDARAAHRFLVDEAGVRPGRLLYYGESLVAAERGPAGLVLRSASFDLASVGRVHYPVLPVRALLKNRSPVTELMARVVVPTAVVYRTKTRSCHPSRAVPSRRLLERRRSWRSKAPTTTTGSFSTGRS